LDAQNRDPKLETLVASIVDRVRPELILFRIGNSIDWIGNSILDSKFKRRRGCRGMTELLLAPQCPSSHLFQIRLLSLVVLHGCCLAAQAPSGRDWNAWPWMSAQIPSSVELSAKAVPTDSGRAFRSFSSSVTAVRLTTSLGIRRRM